MTIEMCGSAGSGAGTMRGRSNAATVSRSLHEKGGAFPACHVFTLRTRKRGLVPARDEGSRFHDVVLDGAVRPPAVAADRPDASLAEEGGDALVLGQGALRDVHVRRIEHHRVLGHEALPGHHLLALEV